MNIQDGIKLLLSTRSAEGWGQMSRQDLIDFATENQIVAIRLFADACLSIGIGEGTPESKVDISFRRIIKN